MFTLSTIKIYATILFVGVVASAIGLGYWYYTDSQKRLKILEQENAQLEFANEQNVETILDMSARIEKNNKLVERLQYKLQSTDDNVESIKKTLLEHDLTNLARRKPGLIEKRIQNASDKVIDDITEYTSDNGM